MSQIDWDGKVEAVVDELFSYILESVLNNKILIEWNNPTIFDVLHEYYYSESGQNSNSFHQSLLSLFSNRLVKEGYDQEFITKILKVYDFIYYIDCNITTTDFEDYAETLRTLVKYFLKGIFDEKM